VIADFRLQICDLTSAICNPQGELTMPKTIAIIAALDTKGAEAAFIRDIVRARGHAFPAACAFRLLPSESVHQRSS